MSSLIRPHQVIISTRSLVTVLLALLLAAQLIPTALTSAQRVAAPLDLAAMTLRPADLAAEGKPGFGVDFGITTDDPADLAAWPGEFAWDEAGDDEEAFLASGFERGYLLQLADIYPHPDLIMYDELLPTFVLEYESAAAAEEGFLAAASAWDDGRQLERTYSSPGVGESSLLWTGTGLIPERGGVFERSQLLFRTGNLVGGIIALGYITSDHVTEAQLVALAERQLERMEDVAERGGPGLSNAILRLDVEVPYMGYDRYMRVDGVTDCVAGTVETCAEDQARDDDLFQHVHRYYLNQRIVGHFNDDEVTSGYSVVIFATEDADDADRLLMQFNNSYTALPFLPEFDPGMVPALGDESAGAMRELPSGQQEYAVAFRTGSVMVQVQYYIDNAPISSQPAVVETVNAMAAWQLACLEGTASCADPVPLPAGFVEGGTPLAWEGAPAAGTLEIDLGAISPADLVDIVSDRD